MALPTIPTTHRWIDGGAVVRYVGTSGVTGPAPDSVMWCWDRDTGIRITDLYDQDGNHVEEIPVRDHTFYCAVPNTVAKPVFSVGETGGRFSGNDWQAVANAIAALAPTDTQVQALVNDTGSATRGALDAEYDALLLDGKGTVRKDRQTVWLEDQPGVATDGTTECGAAIQSAINAAESLGVTLVSKPGRVYVTATTLTFKKSCDLWDSTISYSGTGAAVVCGDDVNGVTRQHFRIGRVVSTAFTTGWATAGSIGVQIVDSNKCRVDIKSVTQFLTGVQMLGHARGCAYNKVYVDELATNKVNMQQTADAAAGFCNHNQTFGGSWNHDQTLAGGASVAGTKHVLQDASGGGPVPDTNLFSACAFEGNVVEFMVDSAGKMNTFRDCRWEATTPAVVWQSGSYGNAIRDGYKPWLITVTNSGDLDNVVTWPKSGDVASQEFGPMALKAVNGTPAEASVVRVPVFTMAQNDVVALSWTPPPNWHTYDVELHLFHDQASAGGTVLWLWRPAWAGDGDTITQPAGGTSRTVTLAGQKVKKVSTIETGLAVTAGKRLTANLVHNGGTLGGNACLAAVVLRRRS